MIVTAKCPLCVRRRAVSVSHGQLHCLHCFNYWSWTADDRWRVLNHQLLLTAAFFTVEEVMKARRVSGKGVQGLASTAVTSARWRRDSGLSYPLMSQAQRNQSLSAWLANGNYLREWNVDFDIPTSLAIDRLFSLAGYMLYAYAIFWTDAWSGLGTAEAVAIRRVAEFAGHQALVAALSQPDVYEPWWEENHSATPAESLDYVASLKLELWDPRPDPAHEASLSEWEKAGRGGKIEVFPEQLRVPTAPHKKKGDGWGPRPWEPSWDVDDESGSSGGGTGKKKRRAKVMSVGHVGKDDMERRFLKLGSEPELAREFLEEEAKKTGDTILELVATVGPGKKRSLMSDEELRRSDFLAQIVAAASEIGATYEAIGIALFDEPAKTTVRKLVLRGRDLCAKSALHRK